MFFEGPQQDVRIQCLTSQRTVGSCWKPARHAGVSQKPDITSQSLAGPPSSQEPQALISPLIVGTTSVITHRVISHSLQEQTPAFSRAPCYFFTARWKPPRTPIGREKERERETRAGLYSRRQQRGSPLRL